MPQHPQQGTAGAGADDGVEPPAHTVQRRGRGGHRGRHAAWAAVALLLILASCSANGADVQNTGAGPASGPSSVGAGTSSTTTPPSAVAGDTPPAGVDVKMLTPADQPDVQHLSFRYGPIKIQPGQNNITVSKGQVPKPDVDGWIVAIKPNLKRADGSVPPVDVIHLHHGVWLNLSRKDPTADLPERIFASGEEKTWGYSPPGYGYDYKAKDNWLINYMLHNLLSTPDEVFITYDLDFIPKTAPGAAAIKKAWPVWMDVVNGSAYPVFDVLKGTGTDGEYTYPDDATNPYPDGRKLNEWTVDKDSVMLMTAGHLHPGGLHTDLYVDRPGATPSTAHVFESEAMYYEPAGAVSWDVAMTATAPDWMVAVKKGDVLRTTATYDTKRASWYESMGIMVVWFTDAASATGRDPFTTKVDGRGMLTHGHLPENDNHGGNPDPKFVDLTSKPDGAAADTVTIADFAYAPGDMSGIYNDVPTVKQGGTIHFVNKDAPIGVGIWHTITACKAPCDRSTGVAYPLADADVGFDSGELGKAGQPTAGRDDWTLPKDLAPGTYTYFCRIHPSMRGGFRVTP